MSESGVRPRLQLCEESACILPFDTKYLQNATLSARFVRSYPYVE